MKQFVLGLLCCAFHLPLFPQTITYPHPVQYLQLRIENQPVQMAYLDVQPQHPNGQSVLLLHGKNFNALYWEDVIGALSKNGFRVIVPDQVGWGKSGKPNIHYSFHLLASNTKQLLEHLQVKQTHVLGHSMGGMLAARFVLMYPRYVNKLILENPIGLEDYKTFVPYQSIDTLYANELKATAASVGKYQQTYYPVWKPAYEKYAISQWEALQYPSFKEASWASALTYQMIYEQPLVYEFRHIKQPTLLIMGQEDRTVVGKNLLSANVASQHGHYPSLGKWLQQQVQHSILLALPGVGHIPHIQEPGVFNEHIIRFLK